MKGKRGMPTEGIGAGAMRELETKLRNEGKQMTRRFLMVAMIVCASTNVRASVSVQKVEYKGWKNCYRDQQRRS